MLFNSFSFIVFFPIVLLVYFIIPRKARYIWLLLASYVFYMFWNPVYALLLLLSTGLTYACARLTEKYRNQKSAAKTAMTVCLILNLSILFVFKYFNFFSESIASILSSFNISVSAPSFSLLLPVGISFYIFQAVGYTIDVYRGEIEAEKNFLKYALFVSFFPQLVAGPIERSKNLLPQLRNLENIHLLDFSRLQTGALTMLYGFFLKMVISDRAKLYVDRVLAPDNYLLYPGVLMIIGAILFSLQIYTDFAGYTYIAIGTAKMMGINLCSNFNTPYFAESIRDFWSRWHISLTTWFRDYLYIPLGGNRKGKARKYFNIFIVFLLSGLWHGAAWHFVVWGIIHGVLRIVDDLTSDLRKRFFSFLGLQDSFSAKLFRIIGTFAMTTIAWVFFRAETFSHAIALIKTMTATFNPWSLSDGALFLTGLDAKEWNVLILALIIMLAVSIAQYKKNDICERFKAQGWIFKGLVFVLGITAIVVFGIYGEGYDAASFIYFQF